MNRRALHSMVIGALLLIGPALLADEHKCSFRRLAGDWGFTGTGTRTGVGPIAAVGIYTLDEDGNILNGKQTISFNGLVVEETFSGTSTLNEDCTGTSVVNVTSPVLNRTSHLSFVDVNDMNESRLIFTDAGTILTSEAKRIFSR